MSAPLSSLHIARIVNHAMHLAAIAVYHAAAYSRYANIARKTAGSVRCRYAAYAGAHKRRAARYARLHNETLATLRG